MDFHIFYVVCVKAQKERTMSTHIDDLVNDIYNTIHSSVKIKGRQPDWLIYWKNLDKNQINTVLEKMSENEKSTLAKQIEKRRKAFSSNNVIELDNDDNVNEKTKTPTKKLDNENEKTPTKKRKIDQIQSEETDSDNTNIKKDAKKEQEPLNITTLKLMVRVSELENTVSNMKNVIKTFGMSM